jgi:hypothetical protein
MVLALASVEEPDDAAERFGGDQSTVCTDDGDVDGLLAD